MSFSRKNEIAYIRSDNRTYEKTAEKVFKFFRKIFIKVKCEAVENGKIIVIPSYKKYNKIITTRIITQLNEYIDRNNINDLVFESNLQFIEDRFKENINFSEISTDASKKNNGGYNILNGKLLMKRYVLKILEHIFKINKQNMNLENVYIFVNKYTKSNIYMIEQLIAKFKTVNIVTENLRDYSRFEKKLYNDGILITVSNNKRKSARNAKYIINMDFEKENLEKYNINMNSIIINTTNEVIFFEKKFRGVLINNFELSINDNTREFVNEFYGNINSKIYLESILYSGEEYLGKAEELYMDYNAKLLELKGFRGTLQNCEFLV